MSFFTAVLARHGRNWRLVDLDVEDAEDLDDLAELVRNALPGAGPGLAIIEREDSWFALVRVDDDGDARPFVSDLAESLRSRYAAVLEPAGDVDVAAEYDLVGVPAAVGAAPSGLDDADDADDDLVAGDDAADDEFAFTATVSAVDDDLDGEPDLDREPAGPDIDEGARLALAPELSDLEIAAAAVPRAWAGDPTLLEDLGCSAADLVLWTAESADDPAAALASIGAACGFDEALDALR